MKKKMIDFARKKGANLITKKDVIEKKFHDCNEKVTISLNGKNHDIKLNGKSRYYQVSKQTSGNSTGKGIAIGIGGISMIEIKDEELARLIMYQNR